jgi:predicted lysophospholipase L1 biosynthesis ABC-type transport system permease subunit
MQKDYFKDISEIKDLMNRSSRFISLSGLSGILAGCYALISAAVAYLYFLPHAINVDYSSTKEIKVNYIILDLILVAAFSIVTAIILTMKKAKSNQEKFGMPPHSDYYLIF